MKTENQAKDQENKKEKIKSNQQELRIDLHVKQLKMLVTDPTPIRVIWSRGKK